VDDCGPELEVAVLVVVVIGGGRIGGGGVGC
jgi:hypothetical protein